MALLDNLPLLWESFTDAEKNDLYRLILDGVYVRGKEIEVIEARPHFRASLEDAAVRLAKETGETLPYTVGRSGLRGAGDTREKQV